MKKSVKAIIAVAVVIVIAIGGIVGGVLYNKAQEAKMEEAIAQEVEALNKLEADEDIEQEAYFKQVNEILERKVVEKGKYAVLEESIKGYLKEYYYSGVDEATNIFDSDAFNFEVIVHEGTDFKNAKKAIDDAKYVLDKSIEKYNKFLDEKNAEEYIADKGFNDKQKEIFKNAIDDIKGYTDKKTSDTYFDMLNAAKDLLVESEDLVAFLEKHPYKDYAGAPTFETNEEVSEFQKYIDDYIKAANKMSELGESVDDWLKNSN